MVLENRQRGSVVRDHRSRNLVHGSPCRPVEHSVVNQFTHPRAFPCHDKLLFRSMTPRRQCRPCAGGKPSRASHFRNPRGPIKIAPPNALIRTIRLPCSIHPPTQHRQRWSHARLDRSPHRLPSRPDRPVKRTVPTLTSIRPLHCCPENTAERTQGGTDGGVPTGDVILAHPGAAVEGGEVDLLIAGMAFPSGINFAIVHSERGTDVGADGSIDDLVNCFPGKCHCAREEN